MSNLIELEEYRQKKFRVLKALQDLYYRPDELVYKNGHWIVYSEGDIGELDLGPTIDDALRALY